MSIKVFQTNANGKIEFTRCELEKLLNETYNEGYRAGENQAKGQYWTWAPNWSALTGDSTINKITANKNTVSDCLNSAYETKADAIKDSSKISTTIDSGAVSVSHNGAKAAITTCINNEAPRTYTIDLGKNSDFDSMAKTIGEILYGHPKQSAHGELTDPFISLAKELSGV